MNFEFEWETTEQCPICDGQILIPNGKVAWLNMDFWYLICVNCNLKFMNPRPTLDSYKYFYENIFWEQKFENVGFHKSGQMWNHGKYIWDNDKKWDKKQGKEILKEKLKNLRFDLILSIICDFIELRESSSILEVGAGIGVTLDLLNKKYNCKTHAVEPSKEARKMILDLGNIELVGKYAEDLENFSNPNNKYDCIIFSHSLENTLNPSQIIGWAKNLLNKNGIIYIQCSNLFTFDQMNPYHPYIFSYQSLKYLGNNNQLLTNRVGKKIDKMLNVVFTNNIKI